MSCKSHVVDTAPTHLSSWSMQLGLLKNKQSVVGSMGYRWRRGGGQILRHMPRSLVLVSPTSTVSPESQGWAFARTSMSYQISFIIEPIEQQRTFVMSPLLGIVACCVVSWLFPCSIVHPRLHLSRLTFWLAIPPPKLCPSESTPSILCRCASVWALPFLPSHNPSGIFD